MHRSAKRRLRQRLVSRSLLFASRRRQPPAGRARGMRIRGDARRGRRSRALDERPGSVARHHELDAGSGAARRPARDELAGLSPEREPTVPDRVEPCRRPRAGGDQHDGEPALGPTGGGSPGDRSVGPDPGVHPGIRRPADRDLPGRALGRPGARRDPGRALPHHRDPRAVRQPPRRRDGARVGRHRQGKAPGGRGGRDRRRGPRRSRRPARAVRHLPGARDRRSGSDRRETARRASRRET